MRLALLLPILLLFILKVQAQGSVYTWREEAYSFGNQISELGGDISHRFVLTNKGKTPLHILRANASCGCTSPAASKEAIAPGDTGFVDVTYHPAGRPGVFKKTVTVETDGLPAISELIISGTVPPRKLTLEEQYPDSLGHGLRIGSRYLNLGQISPFEGKSEADFEVINTGKEAAGLKLAKSYPWLKVKLAPSKIAPGQTGKLHLTFNGKKRADFGYISDKIELVTTAPKPAYTTTLYVTGLLQETPPTLTDAQATEREQLVPDKPFLDMPRSNSGKVVTGSYKLRNGGKAKLTIYAAKPGCACIRTELLKKELVPGESTELIVHFDGTGYVGRTEKVVTVYSSDPRQPAYALTIKGEFVAAPGQKVNAIE